MNPRNGKKIILLVLLIMGLFFLMPISFIIFADGIQVFGIMIAIMVFLMIFGIVFFMRFAFKNVKNIQDQYGLLEEHQCLSCGNHIQGYHRFCPHCGTEQSDKIVCEYCGHKNDKHLLQCSECNALIK